MDAYETEEQQIEAIVNWLKKRGKLLMVSLTLIVVCALGVLYVRHHLALTKQEASDLYQAMIMAVEKQDVITAKSKANRLNTEYASSVYGTLAKLYLAKIATQEQKWDEASSHLNWVIEHSTQEFKEVARLRLAKLLFSQKKTDSALALLEFDNKDNKKNTLYLSLLQELKADILHSQNNTKEAYALYKSAYEAILKKELQNPLLKMKLEELGEV